MSWNHFQFRSIKTRLTALTLAIVIAGIWIPLYFARQLLWKDTQRQTSEQQFSTATFIAAEVNQELDDRFRALARVAEDVTPVMLGNVAALQTLLEQRPVLAAMFNLGVTATAANGVVIAEVPRSAGRIGTNYIDRDYMVGALKEGKPTIGRPVIGKTIKAPVFVMAVPIHGPQNKVIGTIAGIVNLGQPNFLDKVTEGHYGRTGHYTLVSAQHRLVVTASDKSRIMEQLPGPGVNQYIDRNIQGFEGSTILVSARGEELLASIKRIPVVNWYVAVTLPTIDAFAAIRTTQHRMVLGSLLFTLLAGCLAWWILRRQLAPLLAAAKTLSLHSTEDKLPQPLTIARNDEVGHMIGAFNRLLESGRIREEVLRKSEARNRAITESAHDAIVTVDSAGNIVGWNNGARTLFGYEESEVTGQPLTLLIPAQYRDGHLTGMKRIGSGGESRVIGKAVELSGLRKGGSEFPLELSLAKWETTSSWFVTGIIRDVTERKLAAEKLQENEARLRQTQTLARIGSWDWDPNTDKTEWSDEMFNIYGISREDFTGRGQDYIEFTHPDDRDIQNENLRNDFSAAGNRALQSGITIDGSIDPKQFRIVRPDGSIRWVQGDAIEFVDRLGKPVRMLGILQDITESKTADEALRESESRLSAIFQASPIGITVTRLADGKIINVNDAALHMYGYRRDEVIGRTVAELGTYARPSQREKLLQQLRNDGGVDRFQIDFQKMNGEISAMEASCRVIQLQGDQCLVAVLQDVTERTRADKEKEKAALEMQLQQAQKMESVGRLAGGVAHDFNNMLTVICGNVAMALEQVDPAQPIHADLVEIRKAADRSAELTRQLLAFARKQVIEPKVLDLNQAVAGIVKMLRRLIGEDISLKWLPDTNLWPVQVDPTQIDQILANLCINARDAIAGVGTITIDMGNSTLDDEYCAAHTGLVPGEYVRFAVSDNGHGMDNETLIHIFEPFFTTKDAGKGTGLGLAMVYGAVKQNHGFINVDSEPGAGTTFTIYLPRHLNGADQEPAAGATRTTLLGQETILVVEDEPSILKLTERILTRQGYVVLSAKTPNEAVRLASKHAGAIHLLMTDVIMPEMNGRDLANDLQSRYPRMKVLFMSGYTADVIVHQGVLDRGVHFIQKPFSIDDLTDKVREVLNTG